GLFEPAPDGLRRRVVVFVRGADEPVEGRAEGALGVAEVLRVVVGEFLGCDAELVRSLQHLQPVLIRAGAEEDLVIVQSFEPGDRVGRNVLIGVPDVNGPVRVGNRCRQVVTHRPFSLRDTPLPARTGPLGAGGAGRWRDPPRAEGAGRWRDPSRAAGRAAGAIRRELDLAQRALVPYRALGRRALRQPSWLQPARSQQQLAITQLLQFGCL